MRTRGNWRTVRVLAPLAVLTTLMALWMGNPGPAFAGPPFVSPPAATSSQSQAVAFDSGSQDIWAPVSGGDVSWQLINAPWDQDGYTKVTVPVTGGVDLDCDIDVGNGDIDCDVNFSTVDIGGELDAGVAGHIKLDGVAANLQGSASVAYPGDVVLSYPSVNSFLAGQTVDLGSSWALGGGATIAAGTTRGDLRLESDLRIATNLTVGVFIPAHHTSEIVDFDFRTTDTIFSFAAFDPAPTVPAGLGVSGTLHSISVQPTSVSVSPSGVITATGTNEYSNIDIDMDKLATFFGAPPLGKSVSVPLPGPDPSASYNAFNSTAQINFNAEQTLTFDPEVWVRLDFDRPVAAITGPYQSVDPGNEWVVFEAGKQVNVEFPAGETSPITVTPTTHLTNQFTNETKLETESFITLSAGRFTFSLPEFEVFPEIGGGGYRPGLP